MTIGQKIKSIRESKSLTQKEVTALAADLSASYLANLERGGIKKPTRGRLTRIASAFNLTLEELIGGTDAEEAVADETKAKARLWCFNCHCPKANVDMKLKRVVDSDSEEWQGNLKADSEYIHQWSLDGFWYGLKSYSSFPAFNQRGERNTFCPACGSVLVENCLACGRPIESSDQVFCTGCGANLQHKWEEKERILKLDAYLSHSL